MRGGRRTDRSRAREWVAQVLYAWESGEPGASPEEVFERTLRDRRVAESRRDYIRRVLRAVGEHRDAVDSVLGEALENWRLERLSAIDRAILRLAAAEMLYLDDIPPKVSIQEAIRLAERYGGAESARFVNGVLDAILKRDA